MFDMLKKLFGGGPDIDFKAMIQEKKAIIIDVRTPGEFKSGHVKNSENIPLDIIGSKVQALKKKGVPVIAICRSGSRSGMAASILRNAGIEVYNGGGWQSFEQKIR